MSTLRQASTFVNVFGTVCPMPVALTIPSAHATLTNPTPAWSGEQARPPAVVSATAATCCGVEASISQEKAVELARRLKALSDPTRIRLLSFVAAQAGNEACVCDLTEPVGLSQPTVSHHLKILVEAGLLSREKRGVWAYYSVVPDAMDSLVGAIADTCR